MKGIVGKVALGEADAGFVYCDRRAAGRRPASRAIAIPAWAQPKVRYEIAVVAREQAQGGRAGVVRAGCERRGRRRLLRHGRLRPPVRPRRRLRFSALARRRARGRRWRSSLLPVLAIFLRSRPAGCSTGSRSDVARDALAVTLKTNLIAHGADPARRDAGGVPARDAALPRARARRHARRAPARAAAGGRRHRPARRLRAPGLLGGTLDALGIPSGSRSSRSSWRSSSSPARSTSARRSPPSRRSTDDARRLAHARRRPGADVLRASRCRSPAAASARARRWRSPAGSASSARRSCSRAACRA